MEDEVKSGSYTGEKVYDEEGVSPFLFLYSIITTVGTSIRTDILRSGDKSGKEGKIINVSSCV